MLSCYVYFLIGSVLKCIFLNPDHLQTPIAPLGVISIEKTDYGYRSQSSLVLIDPSVSMVKNEKRMTSILVLN